MNFHIAAIVKLFQHSSNMLRQWLPRTNAAALAAAVRISTDATVRQQVRRISPMTSMPRQGLASGNGVKACKPLRVIRVLDQNGPRAAVGRMVISGSMADVCAELDRLAAWEAGLQSS